MSRKYLGKPSIHEEHSDDSSYSEAEQTDVRQPAERRQISESDQNSWSSSSSDMSSRNKFNDLSSSQIQNIDEGGEELRQDPIEETKGTVVGSQQNQICSKRTQREHTADLGERNPGQTIKRQRTGEQQERRLAYIGDFSHNQNEKEDSNEDFRYEAEFEFFFGFQVQQRAHQQPNQSMQNPSTTPTNQMQKQAQQEPAQSNPLHINDSDVKRRFTEDLSQNRSCYNSKFDHKFISDLLQRIEAEGLNLKSRDKPAIIPQMSAISQKWGYDLAIKITSQYKNYEQKERYYFMMLEQFFLSPGSRPEQFEQSEYNIFKRYNEAHNWGPQDYKEQGLRIIAIQEIINHLKE